MDYYSEVAAIIGGAPQKIQTFAQEILASGIADPAHLLDDFTVIDLVPDLSLFIFYQACMQWQKVHQNTWQEICEQAAKAQLIHVFYRLGEKAGDVEIQSNRDEVYFDLRLLDLFDTQGDWEMARLRLLEKLKKF